MRYMRLDESWTGRIWDHHSGTHVNNDITQTQLHVPVGLLGPLYFKIIYHRKIVYDLLLMSSTMTVIVAIKICLFDETVKVYIYVSHSSVGPCCQSRLPIPDVWVNGYKVSSFVPFYLKI